LRSRQLCSYWSTFYAVCHDTTSQWDAVTQNIKTTRNYVSSNTSNPLEQYAAYEIIPHTTIGRANQYGIVKKKISMYKNLQNIIVPTIWTTHQYVAVTKFYEVCNIDEQFQFLNV
jgi:hypothetical protein